MATPHIEANLGDFAETVLMPGDPLRAKFIAENFLTNSVLINKVRNMFAYTGEYKGKKISVMGSGMGIPSIAIYSYELYTQFGVENIIRLGSAGSYVKDINIYDVVLAESTYSESSYAEVQSGCLENILFPSEILNGKIKNTAKKLSIPLNIARIHCSDVFYRKDDKYLNEITKVHNCVAVEMESFALFHNANILKKKATCLLTISDSFTSK